MSARESASEVSFFSQTEAKQSGYGGRPALGRHFFFEN